jgi:hypothetical protein
MKIKSPIHLLLIIVLFFFGCKKDEMQPSSNILLKDKTLYVIRTNIKGTWKLCYEQGGFCAVCPATKVDQVYFKFWDGDRIIWTEKGLKLADTKIIWKRAKDIFEENTYILNFSDTRLYPYNYIVDGIYNDTLLLIDNAYDPMKYYLARSN